MKKSKQLLYLIIIFITLIDILLLFYIAFYPVDSSVKFAVRTFDLVLCAVLWIEFIYSYRRAEDRKQYLRENYLSILGMFPLDFGFLRALRLIKLVQLIRLLVIARDSEKIVAKFLKETLLDKIIVVFIFFVFLMTVLMRIIDPEINDIGTALWYIIVSVTSTGYGDIIPHSISAKVLGAISMVGGILLFSLFTAVISSLYVSKLNKQGRENLESKVDDLTSEIERLHEKIDDLKKE